MSVCVAWNRETKKSLLGNEDDMKGMKKKILKISLSYLVGKKMKEMDFFLWYVFGRKVKER